MGYQTKVKKSKQNRYGAKPLTNSNRNKQQKHSERTKKQELQEKLVAKKSKKKMTKERIREQSELYIDSQDEHYTYSVNKTKDERYNDACIEVENERIKQQENGFDDYYMCECDDDLSSEGSYVCIENNFSHSRDFYETPRDEYGNYGYYVYCCNGQGD